MLVSTIADLLRRLIYQSAIAFYRVDVRCCDLQAAKDLHNFGPKYVLIKGGHLIATPSDPTTSTSHPKPAPSSPPSPPPSTASASQDSESTPVHEEKSASESVQASNQAGSESHTDGSLEGAGLQGQAQSQNSSEEAAAQSTAQHNGECLHHLSQATTTDAKQKHPLTSASAVEWLTGRLDSLLQPDSAWHRHMSMNLTDAELLCIWYPQQAACICFTQHLSAS